MNLTTEDVITLYSNFSHTNHEACFNTRVITTIREKPSNLRIGVSKTRIDMRPNEVASQLSPTLQSRRNNNIVSSYGAFKKVVVRPTT